MNIISPTDSGAADRTTAALIVGLSLLEANFSTRW